MSDAAPAPGVHELPNFYNGIVTPDEPVRAEELRAVREHLVAALDRDPAFVERHIGTIWRLSVQCPYEDVREVFAEVFQRCVDSGVSVPALRDEPTAFVPPSQCLTVRTAGPQAQEVFRHAFVLTGKTSHLEMLLGWHPTYLSHYLAARQLLTAEAGPLPHATRHYLVIVAAARHGCAYVIQHHQEEFLLAGGDPAWLVGLSRAPAKLQALATVNALLCHCPWLLRAAHVRALLDGDDPWSATELAHALCILSSFHALAGAALSLGVNREADTRYYVAPDRAAAPFVADESEGVNPDAGGEGEAGGGSGAKETADASARGGGGGGGDGSGVSSASSGWGETEGAFSGKPPRAESSVDWHQLMRPPETDEEVGLRLRTDLAQLKKEAGGGEEEEADFEAAGSGAAVSPSALSPHRTEVLAYCGMPHVAYFNFNVRSKQYDVLKTHDFSWSEHCRSLLARYLPGAGEVLSAKFEHTFNLTYHQFASSRDAVDTFPFRKSVWYYVQRMYGVLDDDYDYREVNMFMNRATKHFCKRVACFPEAITEDDFASFSTDLLPEEKCHLVLLACEARSQVSLMYGLRALMDGSG